MRLVSRRKAFICFKDLRSKKIMSSVQRLRKVIEVLTGLAVFTEDALGAAQNILNSNTPSITCSKLADFFEIALELYPVLLPRIRLASYAYNWTAFLIEKDFGDVVFDIGLATESYPYFIRNLFIASVTIKKEALKREFENLLSLHNEDVTVIGADIRTYGRLLSHIRGKIVSIIAKTIRPDFVTLKKISSIVFKKVGNIVKRDYLMFFKIILDKYYEKRLEPIFLLVEKEGIFLEVGPVQLRYRL